MNFTTYNVFNYLITLILLTMSLTPSYAYTSDTLFTLIVSFGQIISGPMNLFPFLSGCVLADLANQPNAAHAIIDFHCNYHCHHHYVCTASLVTWLMHIHPPYVARICCWHI